MFRFIWQLCKFKANPEDIPYSIPLLLGIVCVDISVLAFILILATDIVPVALSKAGILISITSAYSYIMLRIYNMPERLVQLLSGLLASMAVILALLVIPYVVILFLISNTELNFIYFLGITICNLLLFFASFWLYVVCAIIYQSALEVSKNRSLFYALILFGINAAIFNILPF